jgi:hypothetical protein
LHSTQVRDLCEACLELVDGPGYHGAEAYRRRPGPPVASGPVRAMFTLYWVLILFGIGLYLVIGATHN